MGTSLGRGIGSALTLGMDIVDDSGVVVGTLGQLLEGLKSLTSENAQLHGKIESLAGDVAAQGGNVLDGLAFLSKAQAMEVVLVEAPDGDAFEVFLDVMSLFCCDQNYDPSTGWAKLTKPLENNYSITARKVVAS